MSRRYRIVLLVISFMILLIVGMVIEGKLLYLFQSFWFTSGLLLLILLSLVDQPFFSKDSNIFVNAITAGISLLTVPHENRNSLFKIFILIIGYLIISSYYLMYKRAKNLKFENKYIQFFSRLNRIIGKPDVLFSSFFLWGVLEQYKSSASKLNPLLLFWVIFMMLNTPELAKIIDSLFIKSKKRENKQLGIIVGIQASNTFLVKLFNDNKDINLFRFVEFKCNVDEQYRRGLIYDSMLLDQEQWIKIISNEEINHLFLDVPKVENLEKDIVYLIDEKIEKADISKFVGLVTDGSKIDKVRFIYNSRTQINEGDILETFINGIKVIYQINDGFTSSEILQNKNITGFIIGEAMQLGTWNKDKMQFEKFGWVPSINSIMFIAANIEEYSIDTNEIKLGSLPGTNYPVVINKDIAITHHLAIIGVTGTGKSVFSRNLIRGYLDDENIKVICIDFTGEYILKFSDYNPINLVSDVDYKEILDAINKIDKEEIQYANQRKYDVIDANKKIIETKITFSINEFLGSNNKIMILELPEVENTSGVMIFTQYFFRALFKIAKENKNSGKKICLVLEEAHTIVPEWNSSGITEKVSQPLINSIAQIALQGRKYNIGLLVIAQRTANVSKTILTQCNSIISFQVYDRTSIDFLSSYFGKEISDNLSSLKFRYAIASGKAFKSNTPMVFEVPKIEEKF